MNYECVEGLWVKVDDVVYMPDLQGSASKPHVFAYFITIHNDSEKRLQVLARKWIVRELDDSCLVVEGDGVVGATPVLSPGEAFSYNSCHTVQYSAEVCGAFYGRTAEGGLFSVCIPDFSVEVPSC